MNWWQLPGPRRFIDGIVQDLRDGKNVVLYLPQWAPRGIQNAVQRVLCEDGCPWHHLVVADAPGGDVPSEWARPVNLLVSRFVRNPTPGAAWGIPTLLEEDSFAGQYIWLDGLSRATWPAWREFITQYAHHSRHISSLQRTSFIITLTGELTHQTIREDVCLSHHWLRGYIEHLDMMLYVRSVLSTTGLTSLQQKTAIAVIARLALWDPAVADALAGECFDTILNPLPILRQIAAERGWTARASRVDENPVDKTAVDDSAWCRGMSEQLEGRHLVHSALIAAHPHTAEIQQRIWSGQVGILFPFIEEERHKLLHKLKSKLRLPFETRFGLVDTLFDLEIGHIEAQIQQNYLHVDTHTLHTIQKLRRIRNHLSHLEIVSSELLQL